MFFTKKIVMAEIAYAKKKYDNPNTREAEQ